MTNQTKTILVIPCYNEANRLPVANLTEFLEANAAISLVLVNDGSDDQTGDILDTLANNDPKQVQVLHLERNQGKDEAVRQGMCLALAQNPETVAYWDADLATPLKELQRFLTVLTENDKVLVVTGARVAMLGRNISRHPLRHYLGRIVATLISKSIREPVYDTQCGSKVFRVTPNLSEIFEKKFRTGWLFDAEILLRFKKRGVDMNRAIWELPLDMWRDVGKSKVKMTHGWRIFVAMWRLFRMSRSNKG